MKRYAYLLGQTELFKHFVDAKASRDPEFAEIIHQQQEALTVKTRGKKKATCVNSVGVSCIHKNNTRPFLQ